MFFRKENKTIARHKTAENEQLRESFKQRRIATVGKNESRYRYTVSSCWHPAEQT